MAWLDYDDELLGGVMGQATVMVWPWGHAVDAVVWRGGVGRRWWMRGLRRCSVTFGEGDDGAASSGRMEHRTARPRRRAVWALAATAERTLGGGSAAWSWRRVLEERREVVAAAMGEQGRRSGDCLPFVGAAMARVALRPLVDDGDPRKECPGHAARIVRSLSGHRGAVAVEPPGGDGWECLGGP